MSFHEDCSEHLEDRGIYGEQGKWISLDLAKRLSVGEEAWWEIAELDGEKIPIAQHDPQGPADKPIFLWESGDMYLGNWKSASGQETPVEDGLGVLYNNSPQERKGRVSICKAFKKGQINGKAKVFWLDNAPAWKRNWLPGSPIRRPLISPKVLRATTTCVPFVYEGNFKDNQRCDKEAKVTLKSGECRQGPWDNDVLTANWKSHLYKLVQPPKFTPGTVAKDQNNNNNNDEDLVQVRGANGLTGIWLSLQEAQQYTVGEEAWWEAAELDGEKVEVKQWDPEGPAEKPIFLYEDLSMYLGPWGTSTDPQTKWPVEYGFGVVYNKPPNENEGMVSICNDITEGVFNGRGKTFWLESSPAWISNTLPDSPVYETIQNKYVEYRPFIYEGTFKDDMRHGQEGKVVLKDGTTSIGPWENDELVGAESEPKAKKTRTRNTPNHTKIFDLLVEIVKSTKKNYADRENVSDLCGKMKVATFNTAIGKLEKYGWITATPWGLALTELGMQKSDMNFLALSEPDGSDPLVAKSHQYRLNSKSDSKYERRGADGMEGEWITVEEALEETEEGEKWWEIAELAGRKVAVKQYDSSGPPDKPFFRWINGDMYLGTWELGPNPNKQWPVEEGFGVMYANVPDECRGRIDICKQIKDGFLNGQAKSFWLANAPSWKKNILKGSPIKVKSEKGRNIPRPFVYEGNYGCDMKVCNKAKVTLKDGTIGIGPWKADMPVGNWMNQHKLPHRKQSKVENARAKRQDEEKYGVPLDLHKRKRKKTDRYTDKAHKVASPAKDKQSIRTASSPRKENSKGSPKKRNTSNSRPPQGSDDISQIAPTSDSQVTHRVPDAQEVIELLDSDESEPETSDNDKRGRGTPKDLGNDTKEQLIRTLWRWLCSTEAIGSRVNPKQMEDYARHFYEEGCDSHEALLSLYEIAPDYIDGLEWMKPVHRILLKHNLENLTSKNG